MELPTIRPEAERAEFEFVLGSSAFRRSKVLRAILTAICTRYFNGETHTSEYHIAFDALGRKEDFNPVEDATIRVSVHNLRKKLREYYESEGKDHQIQIRIPVGSYTPEFVVNSAATHPETYADIAVSQPDSKPSEQRNALPRNNKVALLAMLAATVTVTIIALMFISRHYHESSREHVNRSSASPSTSSAVTDAGAIRTAAGSPDSFQDSVGRVWGPDRWVTGGTIFNHPTHHIMRTADQRLFQFGRMGEFRYDIPLVEGPYELHLYFADTTARQESEGVFTLAINNKPAERIDIVSDARGADTATAKVYLNVTPDSDGKLHLSFVPQQLSFAFLNAIEILPSPSGKMRTIRQTTLSNPTFDHLGELWAADQWYLGGRSQQRSLRIGNTTDPQLYTSERYGRFTYAIPVPARHLYTVTLFFSEAWWITQPQPHVGRRIFDVTCNSGLLLKNFDITKEAGSQNQPVIRSFSHIEATPEGTIFLSFDPSVNYALINAIKIEDEGASPVR